MRFAVVVSALALLLIPSVAAAEEAPEILYSVETRGAAVVKSGKALRLSLPANARTTWFTDRPGRRAGSAPVARLVRVWDASGFRADPPNAALLLTDRGVTRTHVVRLSDPRRSRGRVSFRVRVVRGGEVAGHRQTDPLRRGRYGRAALFIDDATQPLCPSSTRFVTATTTCLLASGTTVAFGFSPDLPEFVELEVCVPTTAEVSVGNFSYGTGDPVYPLSGQGEGYSCSLAEQETLQFPRPPVDVPVQVASETQQTLQLTVGPAGAS